MTDKAWDKKIEKAMTHHLDGRNVISVERAVIGDQKGVALIALDPSAVDQKEVRKSVDGWPVSVLKPEPFLSAEDLKAAMESSEPVEWHRLYDREHWRDREPPLEVIDIWQMPGEDTWMIMYRCPDQQCLGCRHPTSPAGLFHHKLIRADGMDSIGRAQEVQRGKRSSEVLLVDQPVFRRHHERHKDGDPEDT
jgi:hypothetical protein